MLRYRNKRVDAHLKIMTCYGTVTCRTHHPMAARLKEPLKTGFQFEAEQICARFGALVRERRKHLKMTQEDVALASGVSRRFIIELESGRITCELGRSLVVAAVVGIRPVDQIIASDESAPLLPDLLDNENNK